MHDCLHKQKVWIKATVTSCVAVMRQRNEMSCVCSSACSLSHRVCGQPGDHVRVLNGPHAGERGMVVSVDGTQCVLLPDTRQAELRVFVRDLTEAKESRTGERVYVQFWGAAVC